MAKGKGTPRSVRGALRRGYHKVVIKRREDLSWVGILNSIHRMTKDHYVNSYDMQGGGTVAFKDSADAVIVAMKFGHFT